MDDTREELSALRRDQRRIEDDVAEIARRKANNADIEPIVAKQNAMDVFTRTRLEALHNDSEDVRHILKRMAESLASIDDRLTRHKRETDTEIQSVKTDKPVAQQRAMPLQMQIALYVLAGVGILALMQGAPQMLLSIFPSMVRGGL